MTVDVDVVVVGAGPTGLMLAGELRLAGVDAVVLERRPAPTGLSKALGLYGRAVQALDYRGLLDRFDTGSLPASVFARMAHLGGIPLQAGRLLEAAPPGTSRRWCRPGRRRSSRCWSLGPRSWGGPPSRSPTHPGVTGPAGGDRAGPRPGRGYVAWAAAAGKADTGLRRALATWFGPV